MHRLHEVAPDRVGLLVNLCSRLGRDNLRELDGKLLFDKIPERESEEQSTIGLAVDMAYTSLPPMFINAVDELSEAVDPGMNIAYSASPPMMIVDEYDGLTELPDAPPEVERSELF